MALRIYRRHSALCSFFRQGRDAPDNHNCPRRCSIWVQGTLNGTPLRRSLDLTDWDAAAYLIHLWEVTGDIGTRLPVPTTAATPPPAASSAPRSEPIPSLVEAVTHFRATFDKRQLTWETRRKYDALLTRRLLPWCRREEITVLADLSVTRLDAFTDTWTGGPRYFAKNLERLRAFCQFCVDRDWLPKNPAKAIKPPRIPRRPTLPFTAQEMTQILAACDRYCGNRPRVRAFVLVLRYSGLRISDAIALTPEHLIGDHLARPTRFRLLADGGTAFVIADALVKNLPDEATELVGRSTLTFLREGAPPVVATVPVGPFARQSSPARRPRNRGTRANRPRATRSRVRSQCLERSPSAAGGSRSRAADPDGPSSWHRTGRIVLRQSRRIRARPAADSGADRPIERVTGGGP
jgi:integrase